MRLLKIRMQQKTARTKEKLRTKSFYLHGHYVDWVNNDPGRELFPSLEKKATFDFFFNRGHGPGENDNDYSNGEKMDSLNHDDVPKNRRKRANALQNNPENTPKRSENNSKTLECNPKIVSKPSENDSNGRKEGSWQTVRDKQFNNSFFWAQAKPEIRVFAYISKSTEK